MQLLRDKKYLRMKYTSYIIDGDFNIDGIVIEKQGIKQITILIGITVAIFGMVILTGLLPITITADTMRLIRLRYYLIQKEIYKQRQINNMLYSFNLPKQERLRLQILLTNM